MQIEAARSLWCPTTVYLNSATYGLPPQPAWDALQTALDEWRHGKTDFLGWERSVATARAAFGRLVGAPAESVAIGGSLSPFAGFVASSLPDGARVLSAIDEFSSCLWPFLVQSYRGVSVTTVEFTRLTEAIDDSFDLIAFSYVTSDYGQVADLDAILEAVGKCRARVFLDASHAIGWLPTDAGRVDFLACPAYKWLLSPRGTAFMSVRPDALESLRPIAANWFAGEEVHESYYDGPLRLARSARRLDISPAWFSWVGTAPALQVLESIGVDAIHEHNVALANRFRAGFDIPPGNSAIVSVDVPDAEERLRRAGVMAAVRAGRLRVSFHVYNTVDDVDTALEALLS